MSSLTCVSPEQRWIHVVTEALAVVVVAPALAYVATRDRPLNRVEKGVLWAVVLGTLVVDGWLVYRFVSGRTEESARA